MSELTHIEQDASIEQGGEEEQKFHPLVVTSNDENLPAVSNPALHRYLQEISQYELLTREEAEDLAIQFREHDDQEAAYRLVSANLRLVVKVAMDFQKYWMQNFMDLIQEGNVGLVQATKKFDPYRGVKFSYYAAYWIRAYILKFIMDNWRLVKIGTTQAQRKLFFSLNKEKKLLEAQGFKPDVKLLAERLNVKESEVVQMGQRMDNWDVSLEAPVRGDSEDEQKSFLPDTGPGIEDIVAGQEVRAKISEVLAVIDDKLNEKEKVILSSRLLNDEPQTLQTIADQFGISRERVRQIEANLLKKLRKLFEVEMPDVRDFITSERIVPATGFDQKNTYKK